MEFLSSPLHSYTYETFDDGIFELPKEMDLEMNDEFRDSVSYSIDEEDDFNDGMYGLWNSKHPWGTSTNSSLYNSSLHLDFIGKSSVTIYRLRIPILHRLISQVVDQNRR